MGTKFHACPNCGGKPGMGVYFDVYECKSCGQCYCHKCADRLPIVRFKGTKEGR